MFLGGKYRKPILEFKRIFFGGIFFFYGGFGLRNLVHDVPGPSGIDLTITNAQNDGIRHNLYQFLCFLKLLSGSGRARARTAPGSGG